MRYKDVDINIFYEVGTSFYIVFGDRASVDDFVQSIITNDNRGASRSL